MAKNIFNRYIWLVDTIYRAGKITFDDINSRWLRTEMSEGKKLPLRTFHNHRKAIEEMFDINIECDKFNDYVYYIENEDDMNRGEVRSWLLNTFAVNNLINESHKLKQRILFEQIPSGQTYLSAIIEAMRDGLTLEIAYRNFWMDEPITFEIEPYCVKVFKQRWYIIARNPYFKAIRIYALDRIYNLKITETSFKLPKKFNPQTFFENSFGIIVDKDIEPCIVEIKVYDKQWKYFRTLPLHHSQKEIETTDNYCVFSYHIVPTLDFTQEILAHGSKIEVLAPADFRTEIANNIRKMNDLYNNQI